MMLVTYNAWTADAVLSHVGSETRIHLYACCAPGTTKRTVFQLLGKKCTGARMWTT